MQAKNEFERRYRLVREIIETIVLTACMFLITTMSIQNYSVDGHSMEPSLHNTERLMVDKLSYKFHTPARGDVIVFKAPPIPSQFFVKRIIAIPGDVITVTDGSATVDGVMLNETYVAPQNHHAATSDRPVRSLVVPPHEYFVMGDNRAGSFDSRAWGFVPEDFIVGKAVMVYWPFGQDNFGLLPNVASVYDNVHQPGQGHVAPHTYVAYDGEELFLFAIPLAAAGYAWFRRRKNKTL